MSGDDLWTRVLERTREAAACGAQQSIPTDYEFVDDGDIRFLVRVVANLKRKDAERKAVDPFRLPRQAQANPFLPYDEELFVAHLSSSHVCLLNKFNVVDHHLLIVTRGYEEQEDLLTLADFEALWRCLDRIDGLGFYNAGAAAGASQRHKHLQLVPLPLAPTGPAVPIGPLLRLAPQDGRIGTSPALPFAHAFIRSPDRDGPVREAAGPSLAAYLGLLRAVALIPEEGPPPPSASAPYNLLCTRDWMLLAPRSEEYVERISLNALGFAGALLVRSPEDLARLKQIGPMEILRRTGVPAP
ncbi:MAG: phosphorylase [Deltaproteobacteria bacterium]|jgi:ATP adenylyltransferase|nr:phosphorylase [Deltaproteobacteria bacterium]MBW2533857.1 phosphorylase [Deltaproteobacteria bacterium]